MNDRRALERRTATEQLVHIDFNPVAEKKRQANWSPDVQLNCPVSRGTAGIPLTCQFDSDGSGKVK